MNAVFPSWPPSWPPPILQNWLGDHIWVFARSGRNNRDYADSEAFAASFVLPVLPVTGLQSLSRDLELLADLDPQVRAAMAVIEDQLGQLDAEARETVTALFWLQLRDRFKDPQFVAAARHAFRDGGLMLHLVNRGASAQFTADALGGAAKQLDAMGDSATIREQLREATTELGDAFPEDNPVVGVGVVLGGAVLVAAAGLVTAYVIGEAIEYLAS